jgi:hypothetical protein
VSECEHCGEPCSEGNDLCDNCAEKAYMRQQERDMESPPKTLREQQIEAWKIKHGRR